jgi:hypothetical protein
MTLPLLRVLRRLWGTRRELWCGFRGHDDVLDFEEPGLRVKCVTCGHKSAGWAV